MWAVDDYYLDCELLNMLIPMNPDTALVYSSQSSRSLPLLAAHLYYRALLIVSSLFRSWLLNCRDRQLSNTITTYTSNHFSPAIIRAELDQVKDPEATTDLNDENLKIKVATNVNEVTASYAVDDDKLELRVKIPSDWPLHTIEIQDTNIVGVPEKRYRSWVLGVQQIITFRVSNYLWSCHQVLRFLDLIFRRVEVSSMASSFGRKM